MPARGHVLDSCGDKSLGDPSTPGTASHRCGRETKRRTRRREGRSADICLTQVHRPALAIYNEGDER